jgi:hypothetical protein
MVAASTSYEGAAGPASGVTSAVVAVADLCCDGGHVDRDGGVHGDQGAPETYTNLREALTNQCGRRDSVVIVDVPAVGEPLADGQAGR